MGTTGKARLYALPAWSCVLLLARSGEAQLHADVDLEGGASAHVLSGHAGPDFGPQFVLSGRLAVLPLLRAGLYVSHDSSFVSGADVREITSLGLSVRLFSPWPRGTLRTWLATGVGYSLANAPSYTTNGAVTGKTPVPELVSSAAGGYVEVPVGLGASIRLSRRFELVGDVGARFGFAFTGNLYGPGPTATASGPPPHPFPAGDDVVALFLVVGAAFEL
jgi:hypothetical protein